MKFEKFIDDYWPSIKEVAQLAKVEITPDRLHALYVVMNLVATSAEFKLMMIKAIGDDHRESSK